MYPRMDPMGRSFDQDYRKISKTIKLEPEIEIALIKVAGTWAMELNRSNPNFSANDLVKSFREAYSSLVLNFLMPEDKPY
jgi:hypothetical protein